MSEVMTRPLDAEQIVFGDAFTFANGPSDEETQKAFFTKRLKDILDGGTAWLPRMLDDEASESGICADLIVKRRVVATVMFDYAEKSATVYTTSETGVYGDTTLCDRVSFAEAVAAAQQLAV